ncbi:MAG: SOS response-associated peptidase family protein [Eubacterium sp.]|nr:SOS response-associated peptidase family protein [Eubacterium sp.]
MCGKYYADREFIPHLSSLFKDIGVTPDRELREEWEKVLLEGNDSETFTDVNPTDRAITISLSDGGLVASKMKWGFHDPYHDTLVINARSESAAEKQMFAESIKERRCVIPASGYYEWDRSRSRYRFRRPDGGLVLLAGIYRQELVSRPDKDCIETGDQSSLPAEAPFETHFTILTTEANECMKPVHPRMPVTVGTDEIRKWIMDETYKSDILGRVQEELIREQDSGQMTMDLGI